MKKIVVALAGQPNVGKSSLINAISDARLKVGNFSGVTVDKTEVIFNICDNISCQDYEVHIIDLPGAYSLNEYTIEEKVTKSFLKSDDYDIIVNVVDATNLQRNLVFTAQLLEMGKKVIVALNMIDEADKEGIRIDEKQLSAVLGVTCIKTSTTNKTGIDELKKTIVDMYGKPYSDGKVIYSDAIEEEIHNVIEFFNAKNYHLPHFAPSYRWLAIKLLQEDSSVYHAINQEPIWIELLPILREGLDHIYIHYETKDLEQIFADEHFSFAKGAKMEAMSIEGMKAKSTTQKIDNLLISPYLGLPIFIFFMWMLFQLTFTLGALPTDAINTIFVALSNLAKSILGNGELGSLLGDGIISGVGSVIMFLPNILILFLGIALLETTGYMSRVAFLLDGFFHKFGLHGKSFIPLVTGFGCSVPAYMAARTLKNEKDRLITLFIIGFMSCGARLPIYVLFVGAFFAKEDAGNMLFVIYLAGAMFGLLAAKILKIFVFKGNDEPFVMEMPKYRMPSFKLIWHTVYFQAKSYIKKAGTFILLASILIWFASNYPKNEPKEQLFEMQLKQQTDQKTKALMENTHEQEILKDSYLGIVGTSIAPVFAPLGFDWKMSIALSTGLAAKEVVVSTLGVLYSLGDKVDAKNKGLIKQIRKNIPLASAVSFIVFVMIYLPCLAASMVFVREAGGWKYLIYLFVFTTTTAWLLSFIAYHIALLIIGKSV
ncbi:MAG: ferrous iron transport protein B [Sulfurovaceae bacterium]|nr:ferrous iron transport protein B [Sulfurovaceae bacterium]